VCGELASEPLAIPVLVGLGVTELSVNPPAVPGIKEAVRQVDSSAATSLAREALRLGSAEEVRALLAGKVAEFALPEQSTP
jgi:phosphoenolpyruvate-protein kinase (PTS system EI component)